MPKHSKRALIRSEAEAAWLAALIDGEGCIGISKTTTSFHPYLEITSVDRKILDHALCVVGFGSVRPRTDVKSHHKRAYRYRVTSWPCIYVIRAVYKFLIIKRRQADVANTASLINDVKEQGYVERLLELKAIMHRLNARDKGVDLPPWVVPPAFYHESA